MIDLVIVSGDSYSASFSNIPTNEGSLYGQCLADMLRVPAKLLAEPGSSNDRIIRSIYESVLTALAQNQTPLVIVGLSFVRRTEIWYYGDNPQYRERFLDTKDLEAHRVIPTLTLDWVLHDPEIKEKYKSYIIADSFIHKRLLDFYIDVFGLINSLENLGVPFLVFSGANNTDCPVNCFPAIEELNVVKHVQQNLNVLDLHKFCIANWSLKHDAERKPDTGHLSKAGHKKFAEFLLSVIKERNIV